MRTIKKYSNRKMYDNASSKYVTLKDVLALWKKEQLAIKDANNNDITDEVIMRASFEQPELKPKIIEFIRNAVAAD